MFTYLRYRGITGAALRLGLIVNVEKVEAQELSEVEVDVLGSPSLIIFMVSMDVKQH